MLPRYLVGRGIRRDQASGCCSCCSRRAGRAECAAYASFAVKLSPWLLDHVRRRTPGAPGPRVRASMQRTSNGSFLASLPDIRRRSGSPRTLMPVLNGPQSAPVRRAVAAWAARSPLCALHFSPRVPPGSYYFHPPGGRCRVTRAGASRAESGRLLGPMKHAARPSSTAVNSILATCILDPCPRKTATGRATRSQNKTA